MFWPPSLSIDTELLFLGQCSTFPCPFPRPQKQRHPYLPSFPFAAHASSPFSGFRGPFFGPAVTWAALCTCLSLHVYVLSFVLRGPQGLEWVWPHLILLQHLTPWPLLTLLGMTSPTNLPCSEIPRLVATRSLCPTHFMCQTPKKLSCPVLYHSRVSTEWVCRVWISVPFHQEEDTGLPSWMSNSFDWFSLKTLHLASWRREKLPLQTSYPGPNDTLYLLSSCRQAWDAEGYATETGLTTS